MLKYAFYRKTPDLGVKEKIIGKWVRSDVDGQPVPTDGKAPRWHHVRTGDAVEEGGVMDGEVKEVREVTDKKIFI